MNRIPGLSGLFWACDLLQGRKPIPQKKRIKTDTETDFDKRLDKELEKIKQGR